MPLINTSDSVVSARDTNPDLHTRNSALWSIYRESGVFISKEFTFEAGPGNIEADLAIVTGAALVLRQYSIVTEITTLNNATDIYAGLWDGTNLEKLTAGNPGGSVLSGCSVGTLLVKDENASSPASVLNADQGRSKEPITRDAGFPFLVNPKNGVQTTIRLFLTTTDNPASFKMKVFLEYRPMDGGQLIFV
jgi:hypothetical protein